jgi:hypothetical protein
MVSGAALTVSCSLEQPTNAAVRTIKKESATVRTSKDFFAFCIFRASIRVIA